jgi:SAM-dependent methyltransferase
LAYGNRDRTGSRAIVEIWPQFDRKLREAPPREPSEPLEPGAAANLENLEKPVSDYILGTDDGEAARLALQHDVWRPCVLELWRRAGLTAGSRVADVGAGPGAATLDLAEIVGDRGRVVAIERSARFADALRHRAPANVEVVRADLMTDPIDVAGLDAAWCRWVACFVPSPATLASRVAEMLRPGGVFVSHEYVDYASWRLLPGRRELDQFVAEVMASWRADGGEPDVARSLPMLLRAEGFEIAHVAPRVFAAHPGEPMWRWPAAFVRGGAERLRRLGRVDGEWVRSVVQALDDAERDPRTIMVTPLVLEIIAVKR